jgi:hypothetical protein
VVSLVPVPVPGSATQFSVVAGNAATLIFETADGTLRLVTFAPHPGWFTVRLDQATSTVLEVRLESASGQVRFTAGFVNGALVAELDTSGTPGGGSVPGVSASGGSIPDNSTPGGSTPDNSTPGTSASSSTVPGGDDNGGGDNSGPGGGGDDDAPGDDSGGSGGGGSDD